MKKNKKIFLLSLIVLIILIFIVVRIVNLSTANNNLTITVNFEDVDGLLSDEKSTIIAEKDQENGMVITLPEYANDKRVSKYYVTKKVIASDEETADDTITDGSSENITGVSNSTFQDISKPSTTSNETESSNTITNETSNTTTNSNTKANEATNSNTKTNETTSSNAKANETATNSSTTSNSKSTSSESTFTDISSSKTSNTTTSSNAKSTSTQGVTETSSRSSNLRTSNITSVIKKEAKSATTANATSNSTKGATTIQAVSTGTTQVVEMNPGEKVYLTEEEINNKQITVSVEYDKIEEDNQLLYNKKLSVKDEYDDEFEILAVLGYMPADTTVEVSEEDITDLEEEILTRFPDKTIVADYDITLKSNGKEYDLGDRKVSIEMTANQGVEYDVLIIKDGEISEAKKAKTENLKITLEVNELNTYILLQSAEDMINLADNSATTTKIDLNDPSSKLIIDDYESDKNYYTGLNYTENDVKEYTGKYTSSTLKPVTINYYGYDYDLTEFETAETHSVSLDATVTNVSNGNVTSSGGGRNRQYSRTDKITVSVSLPDGFLDTYPDFKTTNGWKLVLQTPSYNFYNYYYSTGTDNANNDATVSVNMSEITVTGTGEPELTNSATSTWDFTFSIVFRSNNSNNIYGISYSTLTVESFTTTIAIGEDTPYGTISDTEKQILVSYKKCLPVDSSGNISIELIDNPFLNRPKKFGFNGWITKDSKYSNAISTNSNTYVQTLKTSLSNIQDDSGNYVINLYVDWVDANVVYVSSYGSSYNSGLTEDEPINNNWSTISSILNQNAKSCTNASNREVNIVVLMNGTLDVSGLTNPSTAYTLTSLHGGTNYKNQSSTYLNIGSTNVTLDSDIQLDYLYVSSSASYSSPGEYTDTDGTSTNSPCIYANMYNLRIGRGFTPTNSSYCTFAQVQGGYYNHSSNEFKLVIETGKYYNIELYRASSYSQNSTTANGTLVMGSDIDRANNNNEDMRTYDRCASKTTSETNYAYTTNDSNAVAVKMIVKSGTFGVDYFNVASTGDSSDRNYAGIYVGGHGQTGYDKSDRYIIVEGGNIANIIGGLSMGSSDMHKTYIYVKNGNVINITGGAGYTHTYGNRIIQVTGGCIKYSISGGSNGVAASSSSNNGQLTGTSLIYIGGDAQIGASYTVDASGNKQITQTSTSETLYGVNAGSVCGGANGNTSYAGQTDGSYIIVDGNAVVYNNVFGGGNYGTIKKTSAAASEPILEYNDETSSVTTGKEYLITNSSSGGNGLSASGSSLTNESLTTYSKPSDNAKWILESSGTSYYIKNASTNQYIYATVSSNNSGWRRRIGHNQCYIKLNE